VLDGVGGGLGHATTLRIDGGLARGVLQVNVVDDGIGGATLSGSGLRGLDERAGALGGQLVVQSEQGHGTAVRLELPVGP